MKKSISFFLFLLFFVFYSPLYALTPEGILLLKRSGVSDEKILEMQKKEGASAEPKPVPKINPFDWNEDGRKDIIAGSDKGQVYVYINSGTNKEPVFEKATEIHGVEIMRFSDPYVVEEGPTPDRKNIIPLGSYLLFNTGTKEKPEFKELKQIKGKFKDDTVL